MPGDGVNSEHAADHESTRADGRVREKMEVAGEEEQLWKQGNQTGSGPNGTWGGQSRTRVKDAGLRNLLSIKAELSHVARMILRQALLKGRRGHADGDASHLDVKDKETRAESEKLEGEEDH